MRRVLVLGATGGLGVAICARFLQGGWQVERAGRSGGKQVLLDRGGASLLSVGPVDSVVWAQGANRNDSLAAYIDDGFEELLDANVRVCASSLRDLVAADLLLPGARLVVLSSMWQELARPGKFSYAISKAAVGGLVRAAAAELAPRGICVNGVLPGVVDTAMTRGNLRPEQLEAVAGASGFGRLVLPEEVAETVYFLGSAASGITGQSLLVDLGFSLLRPL